MTAIPAPTAIREDLVAVVREFTARELLPRGAALDTADQQVIAQVWHSLVELNVDRALLPEHLGGVGLSVEDFWCVLEAVAVGDAGVALAVLLNNAAIISLPAEISAALPAGDRWTLAFTPLFGDPIGETIALTGENGSVQLRGRLAAVFGAVGARGVVVALRRPHPAVLALQAGAAGLTVLPDPLQMGLCAARSADLVFDAVAPTVALGPDATAVEVRARSLVRCGVAAISQGIARRAHETALAYAHTRIQGGKPIVEHGAVSDMLAAMSVRLHTCSSDQLGQACSDPVAALAYKIVASNAAMATTVDAVQVMGGTGYMVDTGVEKLMRDAKYCQLYPERNWLAGDELMLHTRPPSGTPR